MLSLLESPPPDQSTDSSSRPLPLRMRADLIVQTQQFRGRDCVVVNDPLAARYFRFEPEEFALLRMLDGRASWHDLQRQFERQFAPQRIGLGELQRFVGRAFRDSLIVSDRPGQGEQLGLRHDQRRGQRRQQTLENLLAIRLPLVNPDRLLGRLNRVLGWLFSTGGLIAGGLLCLSALILFAVEFDQFRQRLPAFHEFIAAKNWWLLAGTLAATKIIHELGHGLACKRFGRECRELGLMFLLGTPCLYCNVSDSWLLPSRRRRAAVAAAGMYVELLLAASAAWLWWFSRPGPLHFLCLDVMVVCSISTLIFNANPLLRCDGYFILSDLLELPNLRQRANEAFFRASAVCLGLPARTSIAASRGPWWLAGYAAMAAGYRLSVAISAVMILLAALTPYGLRPLGQIIAAAVAYSLLVRPAVAGARWLSNSLERQRLRCGRLLLIGGLIATLLAAVCLIPLPRNVVCECRVQAQGATAVYVEAAGSLRAVYVRPGQPVEPGQPLLTLENLDARLLVEQLSEQRSELAARLDSLRQRGLRGETETLQDIEPTRQAIAAIDERLEIHAAQLRRLKVVAPTAGIVRAISDSHDDGRDSAPLLHRENLGSWFADGRFVCEIIDPRSYEAEIEIPVGEVEFVRAGQPAEILLDYSPWTSLASCVGEVSQSPGVGNGNEGICGHDGNDAGRCGAAKTPAFCARCPLNAGQAVLLGSSGRVKIHVGHATLLQRGWRWLCLTFA